MLNQIHPAYLINQWKDVINQTYTNCEGMNAFFLMKVIL